MWCRSWTEPEGVHANSIKDWISCVWIFRLNSSINTDPSIYGALGSRLWRVVRSGCLERYFEPENGIVVSRKSLSDARNSCSGDWKHEHMIRVAQYVLTLWLFGRLVGGSWPRRLWLHVEGITSSLSQSQRPVNKNVWDHEVRYCWKNFSQISREGRLSQDPNVASLCI